MIMLSIKNIYRLVGMLPFILFIAGCSKVATNNEISDSRSIQSSVSSVNQLKEVYELQERCGKRSDEWFVNEYGKSGVIDTKDGQSVSSYRNHYDEVLNKCFVLLTTSSIPFKNKKVQPSTLVSLFDLNERKEIGMYFQVQGDPSPFQCSVADETCNSESEWKARIARYMGD